MANQFDFACPSCGRDNRIHIIAEVAVLLVEDGTEAEGDHEWGDESTAYCFCGWIGKVKELEDGS